jgi:hypothetical protein
MWIKFETVTGMSTGDWIPPYVFQDSGGTDEACRLIFEKTATSWKWGVRYDLESGTEVDFITSDEVDIEAAAHSFEVRYHQASSASANDGMISLFRDGDFVARTEGLDTWITSPNKIFAGFLPKLGVNMPGAPWTVDIVLDEVIIRNDTAPIEDNNSAIRVILPDAASAAGNAPDPTTAETLTIVVDTPSATGNAPDPALSATLTLDTPSAVGNAPDPSTSAAALVVVDTPGTAGNAPDPTLDVVLTLGTPAAAGNAPDPTTSEALTIVADTPAAAGNAPDPLLQVVLTLDTASATGNAPDPTFVRSIIPATPDAVGNAPDTSLTVVLTLGTASAVGNAPLVSTSEESQVQVDTPAAAGNAPDPALTVVLTLDTPAAAAAAPDPVVAQTLVVDTPSAAANAPDPALAVVLVLDTASAVGNAPDPSVSGSLTVQVDTPAAAANAPDAALSVDLTLDTASASATTPLATPGIASGAVQFRSTFEYGDKSEWTSEPIGEVDNNVITPGHDNTQRALETATSNSYALGGPYIGVSTLTAADLGFSLRMWVKFASVTGIATDDWIPVALYQSASIDVGVYLVFVKTATSWKWGVRYELESGSFANLITDDEVDITAAAHRFEVRYHKTSGASADDGMISLLRDDEFVARVEGLDTWVDNATGLFVGYLPAGVNEPTGTWTVDIITDEIQVRNDTAPTEDNNEAIRVILPDPATAAANAPDPTATESLTLVLDTPSAAGNAPDLALIDVVLTQVDTASAVGGAPDPALTVVLTLDTAGAVGAAPDPTTSGSLSITADTPAVGAAAPDLALIDVVLSLDTAGAAGNAPDPTFSSATIITPDTAGAVANAPDPALSVALVLDTASAVGNAPDPVTLTGLVLDTPSAVAGAPGVLPKVVLGLDTGSCVAVAPDPSTVSGSPAAVGHYYRIVTQTRRIR